MQLIVPSLSQTIRDKAMTGLFFHVILLHMSIYFTVFMAMLTRDQLDHLCMLTALELTEEEKVALLPQLSAILDFVGQLDQCVLDDEGSDATPELVYQPTALSAEPNRTPDLLVNIRHHIVNSMPHLKTGLSKE